MSSYLSIVVPITNSANKLQKLELWLSQSIELKYNIEVILIHDKRDEETSLELSQIANKYSKMLNIKLFEKPIGSPGITRNFGFKLATSKWIVFWDVDDIPNLANVYSELMDPENNYYDAIVGHFSISNESRAIIFEEKAFMKDEIELIIRNPGLWRFIFKKDSINNIEFKNYFMGEDQIFILDFLLTLPKIKYVNLNFYTYFTGNVNQATRNPQKINQLSLVIDYLQENSIKSNDEQQSLIMKFLASQYLTIFKRGRLFNKVTHVIKILVYIIWKNKKHKLKFVSLFLHIYNLKRSL